MSDSLSPRLGLLLVWFVLAVWLLPILVGLAFSYSLARWVGYAPLTRQIAPFGAGVAVVTMTKLVLLVPVIVLALWWFQSRLLRIVIGSVSVLAIVGSYVGIRQEQLRPLGNPIDLTNRFLNALTFTFTFSNSWLAGMVVIALGVALLGIVALALVRAPRYNH
ncbi:MAG: hypothetical protein MP439_11125 [Ferrimicrobium sp.]|nr:hypothetical protein [Ferrimicrobium sp.]